MIRWSHLIPRVAVVAAAVLALTFGLNHWIRWAMIAAGERLVGAKVEIGRVQASLWSGEIRLWDVTVADPHEPMKNLFEAGELVLTLDRGALLHKKFVVRDGRASGLRFCTARSSPGTLTPRPRRDWPEFDISSEQVEQYAKKFELPPTENPGEYFLGPDLEPRAVALGRWATWVRRNWPEPVDEPSPERRGVTVDLERTKRPIFLVELLAIEGEAVVDEDRYAFRGTALDLTTQPAAYGKPAMVQLAVEGTVPMHIEAVIDQTGTSPRHRLSVDCPSIAEPPRVLGKPEQLALVVSPGKTRVSGQIELVGDDVAGSLSLRQEHVSLSPQFGPQMASGPPVGPSADDLEAALDGIRTIDAKVEIGGTVQKPRYRFQWDLGSQLAGAIGGLLRRDRDAADNRPTPNIPQRF